jgi:hypothetical protein
MKISQPPPVSPSSLVTGEYWRLSGWKGKKEGEGLAPLSLKLPFPAILLSERLSILQAGKGIKGLGM